MRNLFILLSLLFAIPAFAGAPSPEMAVKYLYKAAAKSDVKKANKVLTGKAMEIYGNEAALTTLNAEQIAAEKFKMVATIIERDHHESLYLVQALKKSNKELVREFKAICEEYEELKCTGHTFDPYNCFTMTRFDCEVSE